MIVEHLVELFSVVPSKLAVFVLSMLPVTELRLSIPIGIEVYNLAPVQTAFIAILGNIVPMFFLLLLFPHINMWLRKQKFIGKFIAHKLDKTEKAFAGKYAKHGALALVLFVGVPLPFTGAWTGSFAAFLFNIPFKKSFPLIIAGLCIAATAVTLLTLFAGGTIRAIG